MFILETVCFALAGLIAGSFATAIIHREPQDISWTKIRGQGADKAQRRSMCPSCKTPLSAKELIPLLSWVLQRGKCAHCVAPVSKLYPLTELGCMIAACTIYFTLGLSPLSFFMLAALPFLAALFVIDLQHMILPNILVLIVGVIGFIRLMIEAMVFNTIDPVLIGMNYILAVFVYAGLAWGMAHIFRAALKKDALGFGDVKFFAVAGLWLGLLKLADFCIIAGILGVALALLWKFIREDSVFPFGPALILALFGLLLVDGSLLV